NALKSEAAATLTSLLERAERAEREQGEAWATLSKVSNAIASNRWLDLPDGGDVTLAEQVRRIRADLEAAEARIKELEQALEPFAQALKGNYSHQSDSLLIVAGFNAHDLRFSFQLADFRRARAVKGE